MSLSEQIWTLDAKTSSGVTATYPVPTDTMLVATLRVTASSGTTPTLQTFLEHSPDGSNWYVLPYDQQLTAPATIADDAAANTNRKNINGAAALTTSPSSHTAVYKHVPAGMVRGRHVITGTTPSFTFEGYLEGK